MNGYRQVPYGLFWAFLREWPGPLPQMHSRTEHGEMVLSFGEGTERIAYEQVDAEGRRTHYIKAEGPLYNRREREPEMVTV